MQTELKKLEGLKRELKVILPIEEVKATYDKHLKIVAKQVKQPGFRPGKIPLALVEKKYNSGLKSEVVGDLMQTSFDKALQENKIKIVGQPQIHPKPLSKNEPFEYVAEFEVYPEITLRDLQGIKIDKFVSEITDHDIEKMLSKIQHQQAEWVEVKRDTQQGDRLVIDFVGTIDKDTFEGGTAKDFRLELGSKQMIPGFEEALVGLKLGEVKNIQVPFPKDYSVTHLSGKKAEFEVTIHKIEEAKLPEINDMLAEKIGITGGIDQLKSEVRLGMERELQQTIQARLKMSVLDKLIELNPIDVPESLIEMEVQSLQDKVRKQIATQKVSSKEMPDDITLPKAPYIDQAKKRVILGLLLSEIIKVYNVKADKAKVRKKIEEIAAAYRKPQEVIDWHYSDNKLLSEVEALTMEDEAILKLLEKAELVEKHSSYNNIVNTA